MKEYERLTERCGKGICIKETSTNDSKSIWNAIERLAELEDKIENGTLILLDEPLTQINEPFVELDYISNGNEYYAVRVVEEKDLFINLTKAEAEKRLKELQDG